MSLGFLANLAGVAARGVDAAISAATALAKGVENMKVNKFQARELSRRCTQLALACEEACQGFEGTESPSITEDITAVIDKANRRAQEWSSMSAVRSFAMQLSIRQGIESLFKDIDTCAHRFHIASMARLHKSHQDMEVMRERDNDETREMIRNILDRVTTRETNVQQPQPSQGANTIHAIQEMLREVTPEERESVQRQLREILGVSETSPLEDQFHPALVPSAIEAQMTDLAHLDGKLDERLEFDSFSEPILARRVAPSNLPTLSSLCTPETSDSAFSSSVSSSLYSFPNSFDGTSSSPSGFTPSVETSLLDCEGLDLTSVVHRNPKCHVSDGTFAGLVDEMLRKSINGYQKTQDFQETFLTNYRLFGAESESLRDVLKLLFRRFTLSESTSDPTFLVEDRVPIRHEVLVVLKMLLTKHYSNAIELSVLEELLPTIQSISTSSYFAAQSKDLITAIERLIVACGEQNRFRMKRLAKPLPEPMHLVDFDHNALAFAMRLLEGVAYRQISPTDCITHLIDPDAPSPLAEARAVNNKLYNWVRRKVLSRDNLTDRRNTLQTFISVAYACRLNHNFASMATIVAAIESPALSSLRATWRSLDKEAIKILNNLRATLGADRDYHEYTRLLQARSSKIKKGEASTSSIPWLALHVKRLKNLYNNQHSHVMVDGRKLINFERYRRLSAEIDGFLKYQDPDNHPTTLYTFPALSYLEDELKKTKINEQAGKAIDELSLERQAQEDRDYNS